MKKNLKVLLILLGLVLAMVSGGLAQENINTSPILPDIVAFAQAAAASAAQAASQAQASANAIAALLTQVQNPCSACSDQFGSIASAQAAAAASANAVSYTHLRAHETDS